MKPTYPELSELVDPLFDKLALHGFRNDPAVHERFDAELAAVLAAHGWTPEEFWAANQAALEAAPAAPARGPRPSYAALDPIVDPIFAADRRRRHLPFAERQATFAGELARALEKVGWTVPEFEAAGQAELRGILATKAKG
jgi:hypothetical protein